MRSKRSFLACLFVLALASTAAGQTPEGSEFQVNTITLYDQYQASVSSDANGNFVVVWSSWTYNYSYIHAQRFSSDGKKQGAEFDVGGLAYSPQVPGSAMDDSGDFIVVWGSPLGAVGGQRVDSSGTLQGSPFSVTSPDFQATPAVAADSDGDFVVAWVNAEYVSYGQYHPTVYLQRFASNGAAQGAEFQVNGYTTQYQSNPSVAMDSTGNFVVVWRAYTTGYPDNNIYGERFDNSGNSLGALDIDTRADNKWWPKVARNAGGDFIVVWSGSDADQAGIWGKRYSSDGTLQGTEFQINSYTTGNQAVPSVAIDDTGQFVVTWASNGQDGSDVGIFGQQFDPVASPIGGEFQVNTFVSYRQDYPSVAMGVNGDFVVAWESDQQDGSHFGVFGQRYLGETDEVAVDFGVNGLWHWEGGIWTKPTSLDPVDLEAWQNKIAVAFGSGQGGWLFDSTGWTKISGLDPYDMVAWNDKLAMAFSGTGVMEYDTGVWTLLTPWESEQMLTWGDKLVADFGVEGLWSYDTSWTKITALDPNGVVAWGNQLAVGFSDGLWLYDGVGFTKIAGWVPEQMATWGTQLVADFGLDRGLWLYETAWAKVTTLDPHSIVPWGTKLALVFDSGLWLYEAGWTKLTALVPIQVEALPSQLAVAFGPGVGVWTNDGTAWTKIAGWDAQNMEHVDIY